MGVVGNCLGDLREALNLGLKILADVWSTRFSELQLHNGFLQESPGSKQRLACFLIVPSVLSVHSIPSRLRRQYVVHTRYGGVYCASSHLCNAGLSKMQMQMQPHHPLMRWLVVTFPTGRFAPRWTWIVAFVWVIQFFVFDLGGLLGDAAQDPLIGILVPLTYGSTALVLIYRYRRVFTPLQRQQTKWVVFGIGMGVLISFGDALLALIFPALGAPDAPYQLLSGLFGALLFLSIPLSIGIAILRFRLWDIDVLINRTLVYGSLTAILAAIYIVGVVSSQAVVGGITHADGSAESPLIVVVTTLVIAALFQPLRRRLQAIVDRRFYRRKYDAERTLAAFARTLREEVDLPESTDHLLGAVDETMQPARVSLWLRRTGLLAEQPHA
jgi:hypothetical protein